MVSVLKKISLTGWGIFARTKWNRKWTENAVVAYFDCIHQLVSIIFIVFIRNTRLPGTSVY